MGADKGDIPVAPVTKLVKDRMSYVTRRREARRTSAKPLHVVARLEVEAEREEETTLRRARAACAIVDDVKCMVVECRGCFSPAAVN